MLSALPARARLLSLLICSLVTNNTQPQYRIRCSKTPPPCATPNRLQLDAPQPKELKDLEKPKKAKSSPRGKQPPFDDNDTQAQSAKDASQPYPDSEKQVCTVYLA